MGCTPVPVVHSALLVDLRWPDTDLLQHWPALDTFNGPLDEVTLFAHSAKIAGTCTRMLLNSYCFVALVTLSLLIFRLPNQCLDFYKHARVLLPQLCLIKN